MQKKTEKIFFDLEIIASEFVALNTRFYWERILVIQCQYVSRFQILLKRSFCSSFSFKVIKKYDKNNPVQIYAVYRIL